MIDADCTPGREPRSVAASSFEGRFRKKLARIEHVPIVKVYFQRRKIAKVFMTRARFLRKRLS